MMDLVRSVYEDEWPDDRQVVATSDWGRYWKVDYDKRVMYVPTMGALRGRLSLIDMFLDATRAFSKADLTCPPDWDNISYEEDNGKESIALSLIYKLNGLIDSGEYKDIAVDIETRRVELEDNRLLAIGFCGEENHAIIISSFTERVLEELNKLLSRKDAIWVWQNGKFDVTRLEWLSDGIVCDARVDEDTMLMHYVGINERRGTHGLKELGVLFLHAPKWDDELDRIKKEYCREHRIRLADFTYDQFDPKLLKRYLSYDAIATFRLGRFLPTLMRENSHFIYRKLIEASGAYGRMELNGVRIDTDYLEELEFNLERKIKIAEQEVRKVVVEEGLWEPMQYQRDTGARVTSNTPFNIKSPKMLQWLLEKVLNRKIAGTDKKVMEDLFNEVGDEYPIINAIRELRKGSKYMDTYVQGFRDLLCRDLRIRGTYNLHGTETGRLSSSNPNMQNIPRDKTIKNLIIATPGKKLLQLDYSQAELRVLAYLSKDEFLTGVYQRDEDLHDAVATQMFGPNFTKEQRVQAKTINFGVAYGRGPASIQQTFHIPMSEAKALINNWFAQMPQVKKWIDTQRRMVNKNETPSTPLGRERHFVITPDNVNHIQNEYVNFPIQSIASDMTMFSLIEIDKWLKEKGWDRLCKIIINVHDSIVLEVPDTDDHMYEDEVAATAIDIMNKVPHQYLPGLVVPFKADAEVGYRWGEMEKWYDHR